LIASVERGLCPRELANLERDGIRLKRDPGGAEGGTAHSKAQGRGDKSAPREGMLLFRGERENWLRTRGSDRMRQRIDE